MNNKQKLQATYFDQSDWLTEQHDMSKSWKDGEAGDIVKACSRCYGTIIINRYGRVGGSLRAVCRAGGLNKAEPM